MAENLYQRVDAVKAKAALLAERYQALRQAKDEADKTIEELKATVSNLERLIAAKDTEIERMRVASVLVPDHRDVEETRTFIADLVREIDRCIARLSI